MMRRSVAVGIFGVRHSLPHCVHMQLHEVFKEARRTAIQADGTEAVPPALFQASASLRIHSLEGRAPSRPGSVSAKEADGTEAVPPALFHPSASLRIHSLEGRAPSRPVYSSLVFRTVWQLKIGLLIFRFPQKPLRD